MHEYIIAITVHGSRANTGNSISACYSNISTIVPPEIGYLTNMFCAEYDADSIDYHVNEPQELNCPSSILQHLESKGSCRDSYYIDYSQFQIGVLDKTRATAYSSLGISITLAIILFVYAIVKMAIKYHKESEEHARDPVYIKLAVLS
jgi:hypothetical protein